MNRYVKSPVGAHYGLRDWLLQRLTAVIMALYTVVALVAVAIAAPASRADWQSLFAGPVARVATMMFFAALLYHAWVGVRDILMDYVKPVGVRLALEVGVGFVLLAYLVWSASILWGAR